MRILSISRRGTEICRAHLTQSLVTIGRSPTCGAVLRAPGVAPVHFLFEWAGEGSFDPSSGDWIITDISSTQEDAGEGIRIGSKPCTYGDFVFRLTEDRLENRAKIGGAIAEEIEWALPSAGGANVSRLEVIQARTDSGAVEDVQHLPMEGRARRERPLRNIRELQVERMGGAGPTRVILGEMPGAQAWSRGRKLPEGAIPELGPDDLIRVDWRDRSFYLRRVTEVRVPVIKRQIADPLLRKTALGTALALALMTFLVVTQGKPKGEPPKEPVRVARIEIPAETPPPPPPLKTVTKEKVPPPVKKPVQEVKKPSQAPRVAARKPTPPARAAAPSVKSVDGPSRAGLNSPGKPADVNSIGLLGALSKSKAPPGQGIRADQVMNQGVITDSVSGKEESSPIQLTNPPPGVLGKGGGGDPSSKSPGLSAASTTLRGGGKFDPTSTGPVARKGGLSGNGIGSGDANAHGSGLGSGGRVVGTGGTGDGEFTFSIAGGGLDRESVRRVIQSHRGQIRTCYERALILKKQLAGQIVYEWVISAQGPVQTVSQKFTNVGSPSLETCVLEIIRAMRFPAAPNGRPTRVVYPFVFQGLN